MPWRWDMGGPGSISIGFAQAPCHLKLIPPACLFFVQATQSPSRRPSSALLPKLPWAIENVGYGGKLKALLVTCTPVLYSAGAVAEAELGPVFPVVERGGASGGGGSSAKSWVPAGSLWRSAVPA